MEKRPLVLLIRSLNLGGAERQVTTLALHLHKSGVPVTVVTFSAGGPLQAELDAAGVSSACLHKRSRFGLPLTLLRLARLLRQLQPHTLYGFLAVPNLLALLLRRCATGMRIVWGVRSSQMDLSQ